MRTGKPYQHLQDTVERFRAVLNLPEKDWLDLIGMQADQYSRIARGEEEVPLLTIINLSQHCNVALESIMCRDVDFVAVAAHTTGDEGYLPERYAVGAFSKRRSLKNLLDYIERFHGWRVRALALRRLQVKESVFRSPDDLISVRFGTDLGDYLSKYHFNNNDFFSMGTFSVVSFRDSPFGDELRQARSVPEMYELLTEECLPKYVENNCTYRLSSVDEEGCTIDILPNPNVLDAMQTKVMGDRNVCLIKMGVTAAVPGFRSLPFAQVKETKCVHTGSKFCRFEVSFESLKQARANSASFEVVSA